MGYNNSSESCCSEEGPRYKPSDPRTPSGASMTDQPRDEPGGYGGLKEFVYHSAEVRKAMRYTSPRQRNRHFSL